MEHITENEPTILILGLDFSKQFHLKWRYAHCCPPNKKKHHVSQYIVGGWLHISFVHHMFSHVSWLFSLLKVQAHIFNFFFSPDAFAILLQLTCFYHFHNAQFYTLQDQAKHMRNCTPIMWIFGIIKISSCATFQQPWKHTCVAIWRHDFHGDMNSSHLCPIQEPKCEKTLIPWRCDRYITSQKDYPHTLCKHNSLVYTTYAIVLIGNTIKGPTTLVNILCCLWWIWRPW